MSIETNVPHTGFPESRGGGTAATELPTVASAAPFDFDLVTLRSATEMDAVSDRFEGITKGTLEIATEAIGIATAKLNVTFGKGRFGYLLTA